MQEKITHLKTILAEVSDLKHSANLLNWDMQVNMPPGGAQARGDQLGTLSRLAHERFTSPQVEGLLRELLPVVEGMDADADEARLVKTILRRFEKLVRVPPAWVAEFATVTALSQQAWMDAKQKSDFPSFKPHLEKVVAMVRDYCAFFEPYDHIYDPLLDGFEPGMKTAEVQSVFGELRPQQVSLIQRITASPQVRNDFLHRTYPEEQQWAFSVGVLKDVGYNFSEGRLDRSVHPFTIEMGHGDIRITTRLMENFFNSSFFSCLHEGGHGLYEQGIDPALYRTLLDEGASMALHESQSRLWENLVGRSHAFWRHYYPSLQKVFPSQLGDVSLDAFYKGINRVQPSLIRVEADEATYNLHIMLRLELEIGLMEKSIQVADLPDAWMAKMKDYLGVLPANDGEGVLQDIHWSDGLFGYFPTYALGNVIASQLWEHIARDIPDLDEQIGRGDFSALLAWLRARLHREGARFEPQETLRRAIGEEMNARPYIDYLTSKFGQIYGF